MSEAPDRIYINIKSWWWDNDNIIRYDAYGTKQKGHSVTLYYSIKNMNKKNKEIAKLTEQIEDTNRVHRKIMEERCASDEIHCTCVPFLRAEVEKLKGALSQSNAALLVYSKGGHQ